MSALVALYKTAALHMDRDLTVVLLFSLGGLILSLTLHVGANAFAAFDTYWGGVPNFSLTYN